MRERILLWIEHADEYMHRRFNWSPRWLCELADLSYGVPIDSFGLPEAPRKDRMAGYPARLLWAVLDDKPRKHQSRFFVVDVNGSVLSRHFSASDAQESLMELTKVDPTAAEDCGVVEIKANGWKFSR